MHILYLGQDNTFTCRAGQCLIPPVAGATYQLTLSNKIYQYAFVLTDTGAYPQSYSCFKLTAMDIAPCLEGDYTYTIAWDNQPHTILDTGKCRIISITPEPLAYINTTEVPTAYNPLSN